MTLKRIHLIIEKKKPEGVLKAFKKSAEEKGIEIKVIEIGTFNPVTYPTLTKEDALYCISSHKKASIIQSELLNKEVVTLYKNPRSELGKRGGILGETLLFKYEEVSTIPNIPLTTNKFDVLNDCAKALGGFPLVVKSLGNMGGIGVMKIESLESFVSIADFLETQSGHYVIQKFIRHKKQVRVVVLGGEVIATHINYRTTDFRTNRPCSSLRSDGIEVIPEKISELAREAVEVLGLEFGAADILIEEDTEIPYLAEVNMPCNFLYSARLNNIDIAGRIIDFLVEKSRDTINNK